MNRSNEKKLYTLAEACELLSISTATGRNWVKSGRLVPVSRSGNKPVFAEETLFSLKAALSSGETSVLKGRRNKSYVSGKQTYGSYISKDSANHAALKQLLAILEQENITLDEPLLLCLLRNCAEQLLTSSGITSRSLFQFLLDDLISEHEYIRCKEQNNTLYKISYTYYSKEDTLGFLYMSLCNIRTRKASGSYYTPGWLANRLVEQHIPDLSSAQTVLDPSCGTGIFLMQLPDTFPLTNIYGNDLDPVCAALTRINLAMKYRISTTNEVRLLQQHITVSNFLDAFSATDNTLTAAAPARTCFDIILGNPPWGARLTPEEKKKYRTGFSCASGTSIEIFDLFVEQSLNLLSEQGVLSFLLPEAILNVKVHTPVRELLLKTSTILSVEYLGEAFEQVHCPSIILSLTKDTNRPFCKNMQITSCGRTFTTKVEHVFQADCFALDLTDEEYLLLQKLLTCPRHTTLVDNADFALGIVTGNNTSLLHSSPASGLEPVIKGCDISKFHINSHSGYLSFQPEQFQQTAPEQLYRAPEKLFYRFINKQLMFAYDNTGLLSLNSCNILIPHIEELSMKYIMAVLNSRVAQFIFEKKFRSVKILRSHLEQIPIPLADEETQREIVLLVDLLMKYKEASPEYTKNYDLLDWKVAELFHLTAEEYKLINF